MKILCIGSITKDIFFPTGDGVILETPEDILSQKKISFELGAKYHIKDRHETLGGCSVNVACGLSKFGEKTDCMVVVGNDYIGKWMKDELEKYGVGTDAFIIKDGAKCDLSAIIVDENSGERTIFSSHSASGLLSVKEDQIGNPDWIFMGDLSGDWEKNLKTIIHYCLSSGIYIAFNPRQKSIAENSTAVVFGLENSDLFFVNKDEAIEMVSSFGGSFSENELKSETFLLEKLSEKTNGIVVVTDGLRGAWSLQSGKIIHVEAIPQDAVDTTGAGDAFTSGFFAAHIKGKNIEDCLRWGIANSSSSVTRYGGQDGLLDEERIEKMSKEVIVN